MFLATVDAHSKWIEIDVVDSATHLYRNNPETVKCFPFMAFLKPLSVTIVPYLYQYSDSARQHTTVYWVFHDVMERI